MKPDWLRGDAELANDDQLRAQQLRWIADDIRLRRVRYGICVALVAATLVAFFVYHGSAAPGARRLPPVLLTPAGLSLGCLSCAAARPRVAALRRYWTR